MICKLFTWGFLTPRIFPQQLLNGFNKPLRLNLKKPKMKMRKLTQKVLFLCCTIFLLSETIILAQDNQSGKPLSYGIRAGYSYSSLAVNKQAATASCSAPIIGGFVQYRVLPWVAASVEVAYTQFGGNSISPLFLYNPDSPILINLDKTNLKINSIEIPISAKILLPGMQGAIKPYLLVGASAAFFLQADANNYYLVDNGTDLEFQYNANNVVTSKINKYDFSYITGTGVDFQGDKYNFSIEVFYRIGLTNLNANTKTYAPDFRANAFGVKIGIGL